MGWDYVSELLPLTDILYIPRMISEYGERRWSDTDRGKPKTGRKICTSATLSTTNPTRKTHLERMTRERIPKQRVQYRHRGRRTLGRPWKRWNQMWDKKRLWLNPWSIMMNGFCSDKCNFQQICCKAHRKKKAKGKAVPLYAMEMLGGRGCIAPTRSRPRH
jgi:hypothetical protein